jgi:hypothetical protein
LVTPGGNLLPLLLVWFCLFAVVLPHDASPTMTRASAAAMQNPRPIGLSHRLVFLILSPFLDTGIRVALVTQLRRRLLYFARQHTFYRWFLRIRLEY